jgi:hypothetical protein
MDARRGPARACLRAALGLLLAAGALAAAGSAGAARTTPHITGVTFGGSPAAPTITVTGTGLGNKPPRSYSAANTSCGNYGTGNGSWYGKSGLWFTDDTNSWQAGEGNAKGGNCIGLVVDSWSSTQAVFHFGIAYGSFDHWTADSGDNFVIALGGYYWGGLVGYP